MLPFFIHPVLWMAVTCVQTTNSSDRIMYETVVLSVLFTTILIHMCIKLCSYLPNRSIPLSELHLSKRMRNEFFASMLRVSLLAFISNFGIQILEVIFPEVACSTERGQKESAIWFKLTPWLLSNVPKWRGYLKKLLESSVR